MAALHNLRLNGEEENDCCSICVTAEARYTCPRCNIRYCSLPCYRHEKHQGCSEAFYRDCVMEQMQEHSVGAEDKQKVLEMLEREHEAAALDSDEDDEPTLAERLDGLDLDKQAGEIWQRLSDREREEFAGMVTDGRLANIMSVWTPWWTQQPRSPVLIQDTDRDCLPSGFPAHIKDIPDINQLLKHSKPSADIKYSVVNLLCAYAFVARLHNGDHHNCPLDSAEELLQASAVLSGDNMKCSSTREAIHLVVHDIQQEGSGFMATELSSVMVTEDLLHILTCRCSSPLTPVISALSDVTTILKDGARELKKGSKTKRSTTASEVRAESDTSRHLFLARKKAVFLLSWAQRYGMCLPPLAAEVALELECLRSEARETETLKAAVGEQLKKGKLRSSSGAAKIQELQCQQ